VEWTSNIRPKKDETQSPVFNWAFLLII